MDGVATIRCALLEQWLSACNIDWNSFDYLIDDSETGMVLYSAVHTAQETIRKMLSNVESER